MDLKELVQAKLKCVELKLTPEELAYALSSNVGAGRSVVNVHVELRKNAFGDVKVPVEIRNIVLTVECRDD